VGPARAGYQGGGPEPCQKKNPRKSRLTGRGAFLTLAGGHPDPCKMEGTEEHSDKGVGTQGEEHQDRVGGQVLKQPQKSEGQENVHSFTKGKGGNTMKNHMNERSATAAAGPPKKKSEHGRDMTNSKKNGWRRTSSPGYSHRGQVSCRY